MSRGCLLPISDPVTRSSAVMDRTALLSPDMDIRDTSRGVLEGGEGNWSSDASAQTRVS